MISPLCKNKLILDFCRKLTNLGKTPVVESLFSEVSGHAHVTLLEENTNNDFASGIVSIFFFIKASFSILDVWQGHEYASEYSLFDGEASLSSLLEAFLRK